MKWNDLFSSALGAGPAGVLGQGLLGGAMRPLFQPDQAIDALVAQMQRQNIKTPLERLEEDLGRTSYEAWICSGDSSTYTEWRHGR
jgi:hypothetical protein